MTSVPSSDSNTLMPLDYCSDSEVYRHSLATSLTTTGLYLPDADNTSLVKPKAKVVAKRRHLYKSLSDSKKEIVDQEGRRVSAYCISEKIAIFRLLNWLEQVQSGQLPGAERNYNGWEHKIHLGVIHSFCVPDDADNGSNHLEQKDVFYLETGCVVFWGLSRKQEQAHVAALLGFSTGHVARVQTEDMTFIYGEKSEFANDSITLCTQDPFEKLAISFAMAQSAKLDVFEERVGDTITQTKHVPQTLARDGTMHFSQKKISKLIGRIFIERNDINLNSDMLDVPEFFWANDHVESYYNDMMIYLNVEKRVAILNSRLGILRELLDMLRQQSANQHGSKLEWIVIWLIVAEVVVQVVWNILIKDILGFFPGSSSD